MGGFKKIVVSKHCDLIPCSASAFFGSVWPRPTLPRAFRRFYGHKRDENLDVTLFLPQMMYLYLLEYLSRSGEVDLSPYILDFWIALGQPPDICATNRHSARKNPRAGCSFQVTSLYIFQQPYGLESSFCRRRDKGCSPYIKHRIDPRAGRVVSEGTSQKAFASTFASCPTALSSEPGKLCVCIPLSLELSKCFERLR